MIFNRRKKGDSEINVSELIQVFESHPDIFKKEHLLMFLTDLVRKQAIEHLRKRGYDV